MSDVKRQLSAAALVCMALSILPALADNPGWWDKYNHNHDKMSYTQFQKAQWHWMHDHPGAVPPIPPAEMRKRFQEWDRDHDGYLHPADFHDWHGWD